MGKARHLDTALLWVQGHVRSGGVLLEKVPGPENPADALTKYLSGPELRAHLKRLNLCFEEGRPESASQLTTAVTEDLARDKEVMQQEREQSEQFLRERLQGMRPDPDGLPPCSGGDVAPLAPCRARKTSPSLGGV